MKLPKYVMVLGTKYSVKREKGLAEREGLNGYCHMGEYRIVLEASLKGKDLERTYWHEVAHAFAAECGLREFMNTQSYECFAQAMSAFIIQTFKS